MNIISSIRKAGVFYEFDDRQNIYLSYAVAHREPTGATSRMPARVKFPGLKDLETWKQDIT
jgi:outer membrane receptor for monomeric catechols